MCIIIKMGNLIIFTPHTHKLVNINDDIRTKTVHTYIYIDIRCLHCTSYVGARFRFHVQRIYEYYLL